MKDKRKCGHELLAFGSGAFYVYCQLCNQYWVAIDKNGRDPDYGAGQDKVGGWREVTYDYGEAHKRWFRK